MDGDTKREEKLREDYGIDTNIRKDSWRESEDRLRRKLEQSEIRANQKQQDALLRDEAKSSEKERLELAISALGFGKEDIVSNFPALAGNYELIKRQRMTDGIDLESADGQSDAFFHLQFGIVLSLLESDEDLSKKILTSWPQEYGHIMQFCRQVEKLREA